jgi:hypothetical protein
MQTDFDMVDGSSLEKTMEVPMVPNSTGSITQFHT